MNRDNWDGKGIEDLLIVGDIVHAASGRESFEVVKVSRHSAVLRSVKFGNQVAVPRHQFVEGNFLIRRV